MVPVGGEANSVDSAFLADPVASSNAFLRRLQTWSGNDACSVTYVRLPVTPSLRSLCAASLAWAVSGSRP